MSDDPATWQDAILAAMKDYRAHGGEPGEEPPSATTTTVLELVGWCEERKRTAVRTES